MTAKTIGRPTLRDTPMTTVTAVRLTPNEKQILKDYAWRYGYSETDVIRWCLDLLGVIPNCRPMD